MKKPLPPVLRAALYRRAVACAWLTVCERQHRYPHLTLDALESAIAAELEGFYLRQHGEEKGRQIACALLEDLMEAGPLKAAPSLSFLGLAVMDELCARHINRLYCTEEKITMKMNVTETVKQACGHWPRILPALGVKVIKNRHQACPVCGGSDRFRFDDKEGRGTWFCNQCGAGDGLKLVEKVFGVSASEAAGKVNAVTGNLPPVAPK
jgi:hypothetical protein